MIPCLRVHSRLLAVLGASVAVALPLARSEPPRPAVPAPQPAVDFSRQVRPILSENCFACHGPDEHQRKAKLRLDTKDGAFGKLRHGGFALVPGKPAESRLLARIMAHDPSDVMPPPKTGKKLTPEQIALLTRWVEQGAKWSTHWAFMPPVRPALPKVHDTAWSRNPIDYFILARLEAEGLHPSPEADKETLLRRVTLDLTGLPPTPAEVDAFLADHSPDAYEKVVDRLLKSPRFGEHMARQWLDLARYGDTHGLHLDNYREIWPYRDWVIRAFNGNMPYDQFLIQQVAGDLLPNPTQDDLVATGYNRCHVSSSEGGAIEEEFYVRNTVDQVDTDGVVFLGLSTGCARCHDHKYDPIRQKDYYQLFALFNSIDGVALDGNAAQWAPFIKAPSPEQSAALGRLDKQIASLRRTLADELARVKYDDAPDARQSEVVQRQDYVWIDDALPPGAQAVTDGKLNMPWDFVTAPDHPVHSGSRSLLRTGNGLSQMTFQGAQPGLKVGEGDSLFAYVFLDPLDPPKELMLQWRVGEWKHRAYWGDDAIPWGKDGTGERHRVGPLPVTGKWVRIEVEAAKVGLTPGAVIDGWAFTQHGGAVYWDRAGIETWTPQDGQPIDSLTAWVRREKALRLAGLSKPVQDVIKTARGKRTAEQKKQLRDYFLEYVYAPARPVFDPLHRELAAAEKERQELDRQIPTTLVFKERAQPRQAYILKRGEYDQKGEPVGRDTPAFLPPLPPGAPHNRLGFARWLVMPDQPLTARVAVNRFWQRLFGTGIVKTSEDFGSQGEPPTHPELLDWLAVQFREGGWDTKKTLKRLVMSATYRHTSRATPERLAKDPANRLLSRGPRFRLDAEVIRDQALAASGLLVERLGGPSVKPPQPEGLWEAVAYTASNTAHFVADHGCDKVHRRSMYTFWKRTSAPPQMTALDAPTRETCTVRREQTDTPLQALLLLNETQFVECSRALAARAMHEAGPSPDARAAYLFRLATARRPDSRETAELLALYGDNLARYSRDVAAAKKLIAVGESKPDAALNPSELAAWTMVANLVLNLDEVVTKG